MCTTYIKTSAHPGIAGMTRIDVERREIANPVVRVNYTYRSETPIGVRGVTDLTFEVLDHGLVEQATAMVVAGFIHEDVAIPILREGNPVKISSMLREAGGVRAFAEYLSRSNEGLL